MSRTENFSRGHLGSEQKAYQIVSCPNHARCPQQVLILFESSSERMFPNPLFKIQYRFVQGGLASVLYESGRDRGPARRGFHHCKQLSWTRRFQI